MDKLDSAAFLDYKILWPSLQLFVDHHKAIKEEYLLNKDKIPWIDMHWDVGYAGGTTVANKGWSAAPLLGTTFSQNRIDLIKFDICNIFPTLTSISLQSRAVLRVGYSRIDPGYVIDWHKDFDHPNTDSHVVIRALYGLDIPEEEDKSAFIEIQTPDGKKHKHVFENSSLCLFSSMSYHRAVNEYSTQRTVLGIDLHLERDWLNQNI